MLAKDPFTNREAWFLSFLSKVKEIADTVIKRPEITRQIYFHQKQELI